MDVFCVCFQSQSLCLHLSVVILLHFVPFWVVLCVLEAVVHVISQVCVSVLLFLFVVSLYLCSFEILSPSLSSCCVSL